MTYLTECHTKTKRMEVHYRVSIRQGTIVTLLIKKLKSIFCYNVFQYVKNSAYKHC